MKRRLALAAAVLLPACVSGPNPKPELTDIRPLPRFFLQELVIRSQASGLSLKLYDTGLVTVPGDLLSEFKSQRARVRLPVPAFLIRHPSQGLILFDAGLPPAALGRGGRENEFGAPFESSPGRDLAAQLEAGGLRRQDVRWIVLSHLHWDHTGDLAAYPAATVVVDRREWEAQRQRTALGSPAEQFDPAAMEARLRLRLVDLSSAAPYGVFDHGLDLFGDASVYLLDLSGHTEGSLGLWANLDSGPVLLAGDASWIMDNHQDLALPQPRTMTDPLQYWRKLNMMKRMQEAVPQLVILPGHDLTPLKLQPRPDIRAVP
ncbi:MAG: N-acyl homoserine lactonase family protein [Elusimicrobia bacterium]|nr:N-acyl homoserine lactonase family protein [Elusimicrobiota bacterium]